MKTNTPFCGALIAVAVTTALVACDRDQANQAKADVTRATEEVKSAAVEVKDKTVAAANDIRTGEAGQAVADSAITASIQTDYLKDPDLSVLKINVDTKDGVVTLNGTAGNSNARERAARMASAVKGVKEVHNNLLVKTG